MAKRPRKGRSRGARSARGAACVLVSGGLDSAVLVRDALRSFRSVQPLYVRAGLRWEPTEVRALRSYLRSLRSARLRPLAFVDVPMTDLYGDHWALYSFVYRLLAGVFFSALYLTRGFGVTAWTHALYDVFVLFA